MTRKKREAGVVNYTCQHCGAGVDFNTFAALQGLCNECYQQQHYGGKYCPSTVSSP